MVTALVSNGDLGNTIAPARLALSGLPKRACKLWAVSTAVSWTAGVIP